MAAGSVRPRLTRSIARALERANPLRVLADNWSWDGWDAEGWHPTWKSRVADAVLWKVRTGGAIVRALFWRNSEELMSCPWWQRALYRGKAIICLLFGRHGSHWDGTTYTSLLEIAWWNGRMSGYYEPEWEQDDLSVTEGWRRWFVELNSGGRW